MLTYYLSLAGGAIAFIIFMILRVKKDLFKAVIIKSITSFLYIACAGCAVIAYGKFEPFAILVVLGLLCGLFGDIWLDLKYIHPNYDEQYLYAGFSSFLFSHFFFVPAIIISAKFSMPQFLIGLAVAIIVPIGVLILEKPMKNNYGKFKPIVVAYTFCLILSTALSIVYLISSGFEKRAICLASGMLLVFISDLILSGTYFSKGKDRTIDIVLNHVLYYIGQFIVATSLLFAA